MKTKFTLPVIVLTTALAATTAIVKAASPATTATLAAPAPQATQTIPAAPEQAPVGVANPAPAPNQIIYLTQLPSVGTLVNIAAAQGLAVEQIVQNAAQIIVVYKYANGQTNAICYQLLPTAGAVPAPAGATAVVVPAQTTVVYGTPEPAYYYDPFYYPWPWFGAVALDLGFGFRGGYYHGGGFRGGGFRGGGHGGGHGGR
jgi:hypothetical protein